MRKSVRSVRVTPQVTLPDKSVTSGVTVQSGNVYASAHPKKHGRIPPEVFGDTNLTGSDVRVYAVLADGERKGIVSLGMRLIAQVVNEYPHQVHASIARLVQFGHVERSVVGSGQRQTYRLLSPIFTPKAASSTTTTVSAPEIRHACARCGQHPKWLTKACYCWRCARKIKAERTAVHEVKIA